MDRRTFIRNSLVLGAGAAIGWRFGGSVAWGQIRWEEERDSVPIAEIEGLEVAPHREFTEGALPNTRNDWPVIALDAAGVVWIAYVRHERADDGERILLRSFNGRQFGEDLRLDTGSGHADRPRIVRHGDGVAVVWSEKHGDDWRIMVRTAIGGTLGPLAHLTAGMAGVNWRPALATDGTGGLVVAWEHRPAPGERFRIVARRLAPGGDFGPLMTVSESPRGDACRPDVAIDSAGRAYVAWDQFHGPGSLNIHLRPLGTDDPPLQVTHHPAADVSPSLAIDARDRVWVGWHSNRRGSDQWDIPRWFHLRCWDGSQLLDPASEPRDKNLDKEGTDQSFEFVRLHHAPDGRVVVAGRPSHSFCLQTYGPGSEWSPIHRMPVESWGGRGQFLGLAFGAPGELWTVRREWGANVLQRITGFAAGPGEPDLVPSREAAESAPALANIQHAPRRWPALENLEGIHAPLHAYYGDLHGHTRMSDGLGDVDEYYYHRRDYYQDDFAALTDHDNFVRLPIFPSGWEYQKVMAGHFNEPGRFATLYAQEYTTARHPAGIGHKCLYHTDPDFPLLDHTDARYNSGPKIARAVRELGSIMIPHHTGWTGTDWENAEDDIQPLAEIVSNHGRFEFPGNEPIPHRGNTPGAFLQDGLARGLKFGFIGGSDAHGLIWHHRVGWKRDSNRTGLAVVLAPELTPAAILDAMRRRRTYATTGNKPRLDFRVNNHLMGEEFEVDGGDLVLNVDIAARERIRWVDIVRDNRDIHRYGGEGFTTRFTFRDTIERGTGWHWYYVRVEFLGPEMAWSSPIWVRWPGSA